MNREEIDNISNLNLSEWKKVRHLYTNQWRKPFLGYDLKIRLSNLLDIKKVFDEEELPFWLGGGAFLGIYRDGNFLKWDKDIDLDTFDEYLIPKFDLLCERFKAKGYIVRSTKRVRAPKINVIKRGERITLRGLFKEDDGYRSNLLFCYLDKFYVKEKYIPFGGTFFRVPNPIEEYFIYLYGENWRVPNPNGIQDACTRKALGRKI